MRSVKTNRVLAFFIDSLVFGSAANILKNYLPHHKLASMDFLGSPAEVYFEYSLLVIPVYFVMFDLFYEGRTAGKMITGIVSVDRSTRAIPAMGLRLLRTLVKMVSIAVLPVSAVVFLISGKTLQDAAAATSSIKRDAEFLRHTAR